MKNRFLLPVMIIGIALTGCGAKTTKSINDTDVEYENTVEIESASIETEENIEDAKTEETSIEEFESEETSVEETSTVEVDDSIFEEKDGIISLNVNEYEEYEIPFDVVYAKIDLKELKDWDKIMRYERCHNDGKVYEWFLSDKLCDDDFSYEGLLVISNENNADEYQLIDRKTDTGMLLSQFFYFEDVTYDGQDELLLNLGGFGAQGAIHMECFKYDEVTNKYVEIPSFLDISNPNLDAQKEYIFSSERGNAVTHYEYAYKYVDDKFVMTYELESRFSDEDNKLIWSVNREEIARCDDYEHSDNIDNSVYNIFWQGNQVNSRINSFMQYY